MSNSSLLKNTSIFNGFGPLLAEDIPNTTTNSASEIVVDNDDVNISKVATQSKTVVSKENKDYGLNPNLIDLNAATEIKISKKQTSSASNEEIKLGSVESLFTGNDNTDVKVVSNKPMSFKEKEAAAYEASKDNGLEKPELTLKEENLNKNDVANKNKTAKEIVKSSEKTTLEQKEEQKLTNENIKQIKLANEDYLKKIQSNAEKNDPQKRRLKKQRNLGRKKVGVIKQTGGMALLSLFAKNERTEDSNKETGFFILQSFSENESPRKQFVATQDVNIVNFFGKEINIWSYSGVTINGDVGYYNEDNNSSEPVNWYETFSEFILSSLGAPVVDNKLMLVRLEYQNFVREGYLLGIEYRNEPSNAKLVNISFQLAIFDAYATKAVE